MSVAHNDNAPLRPDAYRIAWLTVSFLGSLAVWGTAVALMWKAL